MKGYLIIFAFLIFSVFVFCEVIDEIVVKVNDSIITKDEYEKRLKQTIEAFKRDYKGEDYEEKLKELPTRLLNQMIEELLLIEKAKQLYQVDMIVKMQLENFMKENNIKNEAELDKELRKEGFTLDDFKKQLMLISVPEFMKSREIRSKISITEEEIVNYYNKNKDNLMGSPLLHLEEILLPKEMYSIDSAKLAYNDIILEVAKGKDFGEMAKIYSQALSRQNRGDAGWYSLSELSKEIMEVLKNMKEGQISPLIETKSGFYIFRIKERKEPRVPTLEESRNFIIEKLREEKFQESYKKYIEILKKEHYVRMNPKYV